MEPLNPKPPDYNPNLYMGHVKVPRDQFGNPVLFNHLALSSLTF